MTSLSKKAANARANARRREKRQKSHGILPNWKACACLSAMMSEGATFDEALEILRDVMEENNLHLRADRRN